MNSVKPAITKRGIIVMGVIALAGTLVLLRIAYGPQGDRATTTANEYAEPLQKQFDHDPRFRHVMVAPANVGDREHPQVRIHFNGYVKTDEDLEALHRFVDASKPPCEIAYFMAVRGIGKRAMSDYYK